MPTSIAVGVLLATAMVVPSAATLARAGRIAAQPPVVSSSLRSWRVTLSASKISPLPVGFALKLTASANRSVSGSGYVLQVYDATAKRVLCHTSSAQSCTSAGQRYLTATTHHYVARLLRSAVPVAALDVVWTNDWSVSLEASTNAAPLATTVPLVARSNHAVGSTPFALTIRDVADGRVVCQTRTGAVCRSGTESYSAAATHTYVAQVESPVIASSNRSAVTWEPTAFVSGATPSSGLPTGVSPDAAYVSDRSGPLPDSVDLSAWAPPVGYQGTINSCTSWAVGYYYRSWLRTHAELPSTQFAPMYLYSQLAQGNDSGSSFAANLALLTNQGVDTRADYWQGTIDYTTQPTSTQRQNASRFPVAQPNPLFSGAGLNGTVAVIKAAIAAGNPVLVSIPVYSNFDAASTASPVVGLPPTNESPHGIHALFAPKYDATGLWVENSWGTVWGQNGWAVLSWPFVAQYALEGFTISGHDNEFSPDFFDDFSTATPGAAPADWTLRGTQGMAPSIAEVGLPSPAHQVLNFPFVGGQYWDKWALVNRLVAAPPYTITVKMRFNNASADRAGVTFGWNDSTWDRVDVQPNVYWDDIEFRTSPHIGLNYTISGSAKNPGALTIAANTDYWLRVTVVVTNNVGTVSVQWSSDGIHFTTVMTASGTDLTPAVLSGGVGVGTAGPNMPNTNFDDFSVQGE